MGKTNSLNENDLNDFIKLAKTQKLSHNSWALDINNIDKDILDLSTSNPNIVEETDDRSPEHIISEIEKLNKKFQEQLLIIKKYL